MPTRWSLSTWLTIQHSPTATIGPMNSGIATQQNIRKAQFSSFNAKTFINVRNSDISDRHHNYIKQSNIHTNTM